MKKSKLLLLPKNTKSTVIQIDKYYRQMVKDNPHCLFIFGDNTERKGFGGQAIIRGLPNTFGIVTKILPNITEESFMSDDNPEHLELIKKDLEDLNKLYIEKEYNLVFPTCGLGTGLAQLPKKAPNIYQFLITYLNDTYGLNYV